MGHSSIITTMRYVHPSPEHKCRAMQKLEQFNMEQVFARIEEGGVPTKVPTVTRNSNFQVLVNC